MTWPQWVVLIGLIINMILVIVRSVNLASRKQMTAGVSSLNVIVGLVASVGYAFILRAGGFW